MHSGSGALTPSVMTGLAVFYLMAVALNVGYAAYQYYARGDLKQTAIWGGVAALFLVHALLYLARVPLVLPAIFTDTTTWLMGLYGGQAGPILYVCLSVIGFIALLRFRKFFTEPAVAWAVFNASLLFGGWSMTNPNFLVIVTKADNVPIVLLIYSVGFTTWLGLRQAVLNDERMARGEPPMEKLGDDKVLVWPDLVY